MTYQKRISISANIENSALAKGNISFILLGQTGKVIGWSAAPDLADAIMVVDYRPEIGVVNLISLPRDLWVTFGNESFKANEVLRRKKLNEFAPKVYEMTGIDTNNYIVVNIDILKKIVDDLGGIDVDLKSPAVDWVSGYKIDKGNRHLNGEQVVWLARNRFNPEGDFFREKNQHDIIKAVIKRFKALGPFDKLKFTFGVMPEIGKLETNINIQDFLPIIENFSGIRFNNIVMDFESGILQSSTYQYGPSSTAYILVPINGQNDYSQMREYIQGKMEK